MKNVLLGLLLCIPLYAEEKSTEVKKNSVKETIIVTATGKEKNLSDSSISVGKVDGEEINSIRPAHPAEVVNRISGAIVNNLGGESHFTAIRNNLSTGADYLFLENGVPMRVAEVDYAGRPSMSGVDSEADLELARKLLANA